jgi:hypothetical protein
MINKAYSKMLFENNDRPMYHIENVVLKNLKNVF